MKENYSRTTLGLIVGNREFFSDELAVEGGKRVLKTLEDKDFEVVTTFSKDKEEGFVETREASKQCAQLFRNNKDRIDGILVTLPNFGDEKGVAEATRMSGLEVPVMIHAFPDEVGKMDRKNRRDSFCGKLSVCNNLRQYGIPFTNTSKHVEAPESKEFREDLIFFSKVCKVVKELKKARVGVIGQRPNPFKTVRYSEKILERNGITVEHIDLMELIHRARNLKEDEIEELRKRIDDDFEVNNRMPQEDVEKTAKLATATSNWIEKNDLDVVSFQCWPSIEKYFGIAPCGAMSILSESKIPSACEADVTGALSMYALQLASGKPTALLDINNNYGEEENKFVVFHCSNFPKSFFKGKPKLGYHDMQKVYGACSGRISPGPVTFLRISTDDLNGKIRAYIVEGEITEDELDTFGGYGVAEIENFPSFLKYISNEGFEHHVAAVQDHVESSVREALENYLGWQVYHHIL